MNPFELFLSPDVYKLAILYFSTSRGLAIVGKCVSNESVEVIQISGEVDPHTGNFVALDYATHTADDDFPVITKHDFENLVSFVEGKIDAETRMSIIDPGVIRVLGVSTNAVESAGYLH